MYERTYRGVSLLATNYFKLLCGIRGLHGTYDATLEPDAPGKGDTYTIALSGRETYDVMQKVFGDQNG
jgi:hypothetical protein